MPLVVALSVAVAAAAPLTPAQQRRATPIVEVVRDNTEAVVAITATHVVTTNQSVFDLFWMPEQSAVQNSIGSGSVIHEAGYVLTNAHVVAQASELSVIVAGRPLPAHVVAALPEEDVAVVKIDAPHIELASVALGTTKDAMVGETVIAIGAPVGLEHTVTTGILSAVGRDIGAGSGNGGRRSVRLHGLLQTDAAINPGNSGGPLFNVVGEQIGVNTAIRGDAQNVGFAISIDRVKELLPQLLGVEGVRRVRCGLTLEKESDDGRGVVVKAVERGSPADKAGIQSGVVIIEIGGAETPSLADALVELLERPAGAPFTVRGVLPEGTIDTFTVTLEAMKAPEPAALVRQKLGLTVVELDAARALRLGLRAGAGVVVKDVERGSPAQQAGIQAGDLVTRVGAYGIRKVADLGILEQARAGDRVGVRVVRIDGRRILQAEVELAAR